MSAWRVLLVVSLLLGSSVATESRAAVFTWNQTGTGTSILWSNDAYWLGLSAPPLAGTDTVLRFGRLGANYNARNDIGLTTDAFHLVGLEFTDSVLSGTVTVSANNSRSLSFDADSLLNAPYIALDASAGTFTLTAPATLTADLTIKGDGAATFNLGAIGGAFAVTKTGTSIARYDAVTTYTGRTTINGGAIMLTANNAIAAGNDMTIGAAGTFDMNANDATLNELVGFGAVTTGGTGAALTIGSGGASATWNGVISEGGQVIKADAGTYVFAVAQTYTGNTTVSGGVLRMGVVNALSASTDLVVNAPGIFDLNSLNQIVASLAGSGSVTLGSATLTVNGGGTSFSGVISGSGGLAKSGTGVLTLSGVNTFTGPLTITSNTVRLAGGVNRLVTTIDVHADGTFDLNANNQTIDALTGNGTVLTSTGGTTLTLGSDNGSGSFSGLVSESGNITKIGTGTQALTRVNNTYSGTTNINGGVLSVTTLANGGSASSIGNSPVAAANLTFNGGTLLYTGATVATTRAFTVNGGGAGIDVATAATNLTFSGAAVVGAGAGGLTKLGPGTLTLAGVNTYTGPTLVKSGLLSVTGSLANNGSAKVFIDADANGDFASGPDTKLTRTIVNTASYAGFGSSITSSFGTTADLLAGTNTTGGLQSLAMQWRAKTSVANDHNLVSDVLNLTGIDGSVFVLRMSFAPMADEAAMAAAGQIFLAWWDSGDGTWKNAIDGNHLANVGAENVQGSWAGAGGSTLALGAWGVDVANHVVWAVLDHNSQFAVSIPAPGALPAGALLLAAAPLGRRRHRRRRTR